jgi:hypothetical protein
MAAIFDSTITPAKRFATARQFVRITFLTRTPIRPPELFTTTSAGRLAFATSAPR